VCDDPSLTFAKTNKLEQNQDFAWIKEKYTFKPSEKCARVKNFFFKILNYIRIFEESQNQQCDVWKTQMYVLNNL